MASGQFLNKIKHFFTDYNNKHKNGPLSPGFCPFDTKIAPISAQIVGRTFLEHQKNPNVSPQKKNRQPPPLKQSKNQLIN